MSKKLCIYVPVFLLVFLSSTVITNAQAPSIISTSPGQNELNVDINSNISVIFDLEMNSTTINENTFIVHGRSTGPHPGAFSYDSQTRTVTFNPSEDFAIGEVVTVTLTTGIQSAQGVALSSSRVWSFTTKSLGGSLNFSKTDFSVGGDSRSVFAADLDGDGDLDMITANAQDNNVSVLRNDGNNVFLTQNSLNAEADPVWIFCADLDSDGDLDISCAISFGHKIYLWFNNGNFSFTQQIINLSSYGIEPRSIFAGDFDGDGDPDLAAADIAHEYVSVLMNNGDGTFTLPPANYSVDTDPVAIFGGDLDGDGDMDLATANLGNENVSVLKNNGDGTFQFYSNFSVGNNPRSLYAADLDGDGDLDLATANDGGSSVSVLKNNGGAFFSTSQTLPGISSAHAVFAADLDGDQDLDLSVVAKGTNVVKDYLNNGSGNFTFHADHTVVTAPHALYAADLDNDGDVDLACINTATSGNVVSVLVNQGTTNINPQNDILPTVYSLKQNYPNPFNPRTTINYALPRRSEVKIIIYNILGNRVRTLVDGKIAAGHHSATWDGLNDQQTAVASGIYFYHMQTENYMDSKKMVLIR